MLYSSSKPGVANFYLDCPQGVFQIWNFYPDFDTVIFPFFCLFYLVCAKAFLKILPISIWMRIRDLWVFSGVPTSVMAKQLVMHNPYTVIDWLMKQPNEN